MCNFAINEMPPHGLAVEGFGSDTVEVILGSSGKFQKYISKAQPCSQHPFMDLCLRSSFSHSLFIMRLNPLKPRVKIGIAFPKYLLF